MPFRFETANERWGWYKTSNGESNLLLTLENISATIKSGNRNALQLSESESSDDKVLGVYAGILKSVKHDLQNATYTDQENQILSENNGFDIKQFIDGYLPSIDRALQSLDSAINGQADQDTIQNIVNNVAVGLATILRLSSIFQEQIKNASI